jgi:hypothetical protein
MKSIIAVTTLALILSAPAFADNGFYLGGTLGHSNSGSPSSVSMTNSTGTVAGGLIGYQFTPFFALEGAYTGAGKFSNATVNGKSDVMTIGPVLIIPMVNNFAFYMKFGVGSAKTSVTDPTHRISGTTSSFSDDGLGFQYTAMRQVDLRLGMDSYVSAIHSAGGNNSFRSTVISVAALYRFAN